MIADDLSLDKAEPGPPKPSFWRFSLGLLMLGVVLFCVAMAGIAWRRAEVVARRKVIDELTQAGAIIHFEHELDSRGNTVSNPPLPGNFVERLLFGMDSAFEVRRVLLSGEPIDRGTWERLMSLAETHELRLEHCTLAADCRSLAPFSRLEKLVLTGTNVGDWAIDDANRMPSLRYLHIEGTKITAAGLGKLTNENVEWLTGAWVACDHETIMKLALLPKLNVGAAPEESFLFEHYKGAARTIRDHLAEWEAAADHPLRVPEDKEFIPLMEYSQSFDPRVKRLLCRFASQPGDLKVRLAAVAAIQTSGSADLELTFPYLERIAQQRSPELKRAAVDCMTSVIALDRARNDNAERRARFFGRFLRAAVLDTDLETSAYAVERIRQEFDQPEELDLTLAAKEFTAAERQSVRAVIYPPEVVEPESE